MKIRTLCGNALIYALEYEVANSVNRQKRSSHKSIVKEYEKDSLDVMFAFIDHLKKYLDKDSCGRREGISRVNVEVLQKSRQEQIKRAPTSVTNQWSGKLETVSVKGRAVAEDTQGLNFHCETIQFGNTSVWNSCQPVPTIDSGATKSV